MSVVTGFALFMAGEYSRRRLCDVISFDALQIRFGLSGFMGFTFMNFGKLTCEQGYSFYLGNFDCSEWDELESLILAQSERWRHA